MKPMTFVLLGSETNWAARSMLTCLLAADGYDAWGKLVLGLSLLIAADQLRGTATEKYP